MQSSFGVIAVVTAVCVIIVALAVAPSLVVVPVLTAISVIVVVLAVSQVKRAAAEGVLTPPDGQREPRTARPTGASTAAARRTSLAVDEQPAPVVAEEPTFPAAEEPAPLVDEQRALPVAEGPVESRVEVTLRGAEPPRRREELPGVSDSADERLASLLAAFDTVTREVEAFLPTERRAPDAVGAGDETAEQPLDETVRRGSHPRDSPPST